VISDTLFDAVADINHYLSDPAFCYQGEVRDEVLLLIEQMNRLRSKLDQHPRGASDPTEEVLEQEEQEFQNSPAGHFFGTVSGVYFELKEIQHERELTDTVLEYVDGLANNLKEAVEQARKHPVGIALDWKQFSEEAFKALNHGLKHHGLKLSVPDEDTGDQWILTIERIPEETIQ
jgi:hypothetical protein